VSNYPRRPGEAGLEPRTPRIPQGGNIVRNLIPLLTLAIAPAFGQSDFHARIHLVTAGLDTVQVRLVRRINSLLARELQDIEGVTIVTKEPDYIVASMVGSLGETVAISVHVDEVPEPALAAGLLGRPDQGHITSLRALLERRSLRRTVVDELQIGTLGEVPAMCADIATSIGKRALTDARRFPRGSPDPDIVVRNFLLRAGFGLATKR
jgi:hypothetical protein